MLGIENFYLFLTVSILINLSVAVLTGYFSRLLKGNDKFWKWQEKITGLILVGLGLKMLFVRKIKKPGNPGSQQGLSHRFAKDIFHSLI